MKKQLLVFIIVTTAVGAGAFYGGIKYSEGKNPRAKFLQQDFQNLRNLSPEERQKRLEEMGMGGGAFRGGQRGGGGTAGEILSKDDKSVTVKLEDGGSKIIFFSDSTEITKSLQGTWDDLEVGKTIFVNGTLNSDGSVTARTIQLRPLHPSDEKLD